MKLNEFFIIKPLLMLFLCFSFSQTAMSEKIQDFYKKVGDKLVGIQRQYPACRQDIYYTLDSVDKMYKITQSTKEKKKKLTHLLKEKTAQYEVLTTQYLALKQELDQVRNKLEVATESLKQEQSMVSTLIEENKKLTMQYENQKTSLGERVEKAQKDIDLSQKNTLTTQQLPEQELEDLQNFSLTSASAPKSPR